MEDESVSEDDEVREAVMVIGEYKVPTFDADLATDEESVSIDERNTERVAVSERVFKVFNGDRVTGGKGVSAADELSGVVIVFVGNNVIEFPGD